MRLCDCVSVFYILAICIAHRALITFLVILFMSIFIWSPQTKGHIQRLKFSNDPGSTVVFFGLLVTFI